MPGLALELSRLAFVLFVRGAFLVLLGAVAIRWPEHTLLLSMVAAGGILGCFGLFEVLAASVSGTLPSTKLFLVGHGILSVALGGIAVALLVAGPQRAALMSIAFLVAYGMYSLVLAVRLQFVPRAREAVFGWGIFNLACAAVLASVEPSRTSELLYAAAFYAAVLGLFQLFAALWIRRGRPLVHGYENHRELGAHR
jgi:uncharacterized membrane protein HdeD (DUF308 family)